MLSKFLSSESESWASGVVFCRIDDRSLSLQQPSFSCLEPTMSYKNQNFLASNFKSVPKFLSSESESWASGVVFCGSDEQSLSLQQPRAIFIMNDRGHSIESETLYLSDPVNEHWWVISLQGAVPHPPFEHVDRPKWPHCAIM